MGALHLSDCAYFGSADAALLSIGSLFVKRWIGICDLAAALDGLEADNKLLGCRC
jgi:hypothetical protein